MTRTISLILLFLAVGLFAACGEKDTSGHSDENGHSHEDGDHDHEDGDHDHEDGDHDHEDGDHDEHDHGDRVDLGKASAGSFAVTLAIFGEIEAGHEGVLDIDIEGDPAVVRAWVGVESGKGSLKAKVDGEDGGYHGHIEVPATLPEGSAIWIEVEDADGNKERVSFQIPE
jgi:hypothetical protein